MRAAFVVRWSLARAGRKHGEAMGKYGDVNALPRVNTDMVYVYVYDMVQRVSLFVSEDNRDCNYF